VRSPILFVLDLTWFLGTLSKSDLRSLLTLKEPLTDNLELLAADLRVLGDLRAQRIEIRHEVALGT
jgi:hypothetical protein